MKLDRCSFQAPNCLTCTLADGNTLCILIYTSISGTLSCQNLTGNTWEITKSVMHFIQNAVTECKWYTLNDDQTYYKMCCNDITWNVHSNPKSM